MDIHHVVGSDLIIGATGDLLAVSGSEAVRQRILRRLISNERDLLFNPDYGAGLPSQVGTLLDEGCIDALVRSQMAQDAGVAQDPPPEVVATPFPHGVSVVIRYRDADTGEAVGIGFDVTRQ